MEGRTVCSARPEPKWQELPDDCPEEIGNCSQCNDRFAFANSVQLRIPHTVEFNESPVMICYQCLDQDKYSGIWRYTRDANGCLV